MTVHPPAAHSRSRRSWLQRLGWQGSLGAVLLLLAPLVWWFRSSTVPATKSPETAHGTVTAAAAATPLPLGGTRQRTEDLGRLLALAQAHGVDVPLARYEWHDGAASAPPASAAPPTDAPQMQMQMQMQISLLGPADRVESMLRAASSVLPHASTQHLALERVDAADAASAATHSPPLVRAQWRLQLHYRSAP